MGSHGVKAPESMKCVGVGAARAARAAGFEVGSKHPAEQARLVPTVYPRAKHGAIWGRQHKINPCTNSARKHYKITSRMRCSMKKIEA